MDYVYEIVFVEFFFGVKLFELVKVGDINCDELGKEDLKVIKEIKVING